MTSIKKEQIYRLLKGTETGDPASVSVVNEALCIQHNPQTYEGSGGYTNQNLSSFFDLYRLQDGSVVEHWGTTEVIPPRSELNNDNGKF